MKRFLVFLLVAILLAAGIYYWKGDKNLDVNEVNNVVTEENFANKENAIENYVVGEEIATPVFPYMIINTEPFMVSIKDGFDNCGYSARICDGTDVYEFKSIPNENDVTWSVYVLDEPFEDADRYISQAFKPVLVGDGKIEIEDGKYVYFYCSINNFTGECEMPKTESYLKVTRSGM